MYIQIFIYYSYPPHANLFNHPRTAHHFPQKQIHNSKSIFYSYFCLSHSLLVPSDHNLTSTNPRFSLNTHSTHTLDNYNKPTLLLLVCHTFIFTTFNPYCHIYIYKYIVLFTTIDIACYQQITVLIYIYIYIYIYTKLYISIIPIQSHDSTRHPIILNSK